MPAVDASLKLLIPFGGLSADTRHLHAMRRVSGIGVAVTGRRLGNRRWPKVSAATKLYTPERECVFERLRPSLDPRAAY